LPEDGKKVLVVPMYKKGDKIYYSNYGGISLSTTTYNILFIIILSRLTPHAEEIIWDN